MHIASVDEKGVIKVVGVGGGAVNVLNHLRKYSVPGVECIAMHSVAEALRAGNAHKTFLLGKSGERTSRASGARVDAEHAASDLRQVLGGSQLVLLLSAFGGAVGTGATPVIARTTRALGIPTIALISMPFNWNGATTQAIAAAGLELLSKSVDLLVVLSSDTAMDMLGNEDLNMDETVTGVNAVIAFAAAEVLKLVIATAPSQSDCSRFRSTTGTAGLALFGTATAGGFGRARIAAEQAVVCPLLEGVALAEAQHALVLITTAPCTLTASESKLVMDVIRRAAPHAQCSLATATDPRLVDQIRVTVVGVGLKREWQPEDCPLQTVAKRLPDAPIPSLAMQ
ncbi:cell division protein FtsZ [Variovorax sp. GrIS 2.14]|uniref:cell division protein FtsZ n=1 Tax=Variovorax sp. GrIS 2.14 TaxID=3071709 RepID=UPI0038F6A5CA